MLSTFSRISAVVLLSSLASAQTWTDCNPMKKTCPPDPALAGNYEYTYGKAAPDFTTTFDSIVYGGSEGAAFRVQKRKDAPTIVSNFYIMFGKLEVTMKAAPGGGIVSSVVLQSDNLDEIDWEWVGANTNEAQSNYFGKGNTDSYDRGGIHPVTALELHTYGLDWTAEKLDWLIDGKVVRTLKYSDNPEFYPQTPCQVRLGSWAAGDPDNAKGTIEWSKGPVDYSKGPYDMIVKSFKVQDYSSGKEYVYSDKSGSWQSIKAVGGVVGAGPQEGPGNTGGDSSFKSPTHTISSAEKKSKPTPIEDSEGSADDEEPIPTPSSGYSPPSGSDAPSTGKGSAPTPANNTVPSAPSSSPPTSDEKFTGSGSTLAAPVLMLGAWIGVVFLAL